MTIQPYHHGAAGSTTSFGEASYTPTGGRTSSAPSSFTSLFRLPKLVANILPQRPLTTSEGHIGLPSPPPNAADNTQPPSPPPKAAPQAPTPTTSPLNWQVPETAEVLLAFLALIYPPGYITGAPVSSVNMARKVIRAALGYQSTKALATARARLGEFMTADPVGVYATARLYHFHELAVIASTTAMAVDPDEWSEEDAKLMGRAGRRALRELRDGRLKALKAVLAKPMEADVHTGGCVRREMMERVWHGHVEAVCEALKAYSDLLEILDVDVRGGHCGDCLILLGRTMKRCVREASQLSKTI